MTNNVDFGGILLPKLKNRWKLANVSILTQAENDLLTRQAVKLSYEFVAPMSFYGMEQPMVHSLFIDFEEPNTGGMGEIVKKIMNETEPFKIVVHNLDGDMEVLQTQTFSGVEGKSFKYTLDYAAMETCQFPIQLNFTDVLYS